MDKLFHYLEFWKNKNTKIIITKHNELPHSKKSKILIAYQNIYKYADVIIHLGEKSVDNSTFNSIRNSIIPHPLYENLPNTLTQLESRERLGIATDRFVICCFGNYRNQDELNLTINAFKKFKDSKKTLLTAKWPKLFGWKKEPTKRLKHEIYLKRKHFDKRYCLNNIEYVSESDIQLYLNACDIVFIPRIDTLNTGNIPLAFTFGKVVVGPEIGNIGSLLQRTGNPSFIPGELSSVEQALNQAKTLVLADKGQENYRFGKQHWNVNLVAQMHLDLYKDLILNNDSNK
ncbi:hypothetical protein [Mangrovimonas sp. YM274]|uniref:hypothetical protein n=1 Tax=Mangrovimonas sp. YM274 TaxID=3070660 RepID=UPI0027DC48DC|nr:hypothetical protein [Mangrovimonas sp. YM274]WMI68451.1 hypothetical protein RBH95_15030 [Mangrovimonas sp. YM274]